jgi:hypothetical protein
MKELTMALTTKHGVDHKLLDRFLGDVLVCFKADLIDFETAVNRIAFLVAAVALPEGEGTDPTKYMRSFFPDEGPKRHQFRNARD